MVTLKLHQYHILLLILIHQVVNMIILHLHCYMESFYTDIMLNQLKILKKNQKYFFSVLQGLKTFSYFHANPDF